MKLLTVHNRATSPKPTTTGACTNGITLKVKIVAPVPRVAPRERYEGTLARIRLEPPIQASRAAAAAGLIAVAAAPASEGGVGERR
jgi:hypothetical protein